MSIGLFLTPISLNGRRRQPDCLAASALLTNKRRGHMLSDDAVNAGLFVCEADEFAAVNAVANVVQLATAADFASIYRSSADYAASLTLGQRNAISTRVAALGLDTSGIVTIADFVQRVARRLEPAASPGMFDTPTPFKTGTIVDDFAGPLNAAWTKYQGNGSFAASGQLVWTQAGAVTVEVLGRNEAAGFPNDQWAQIDCQFQTANPGAQTGPAVRCAISGTKTGYLVELQLNDMVLERFSTGTLVYINDFVQTITAATLYTVKLDITGTTLTVYLGGVSVGSQPDSNILSGVPAVTVAENNSSAGTCAFDNWQCIDANSSGLSALIGEPKCGSSTLTA